MTVLPSKGHEIAVAAVTRTTLTPERLVAWSRDIERLKDMPLVRRVKKLSADPQRAEFNGMWLTEDDVRDLAECRAGSCKLKLTRAEIDLVRQHRLNVKTAWPADAQSVFQDIAHARVRAYEINGHAATPYADGSGGLPMRQTFTELIGHSGFLTSHLPDLARYLSEFPGSSAVPGERFLYWSSEAFGAKPVISATEVVIAQPADPSAPLVAVSGKQIFATHYTTGSLNVTMLLRPAHNGGARYLAVINRSAVDLLSGPVGVIARRMLERRIRAETAEVVDRMKARMEAGWPSQNPAALREIPRRNGVNARNAAPIPRRAE